MPIGCLSPKKEERSAVMWNDALWLVLMPMLISSVATYRVMPLLLKLARKKDFVDKPNWRKLNRVPVPVLGGVGVFFGLMFSLAIIGCYQDAVSYHYELVLSMMFVLMLGVADDAVGLSPGVRICVESVVLIVVFILGEQSITNCFGVFGIYNLWDSLSIGLTLILGLGIINAINLIDGIDGLCAAYGIFASLVYGCCFILLGEHSFAVVAFAMAGALIPFIVQNLSRGRRKIFLGDGGSLLLGFVVLLLVVRFFNVAGGILQGYVVSFSLAMLAVPIFDTLRVMIWRMWRGVSPFRADNTHLHHAFISKGLSHTVTTILIMALQSCIVLLWWLCYNMGVGYNVTLVVTLFSGVCVVWGGYYLILNIGRVKAIRAGLNYLSESEK